MGDTLCIQMKPYRWNSNPIHWTTAWLIYQDAFDATESRQEQMEVQSSGNQRSRVPIQARANQNQKNEVFFGKLRSQKYVFGQKNPSKCFGKSDNHLLRKRLQLKLFWDPHFNWSEPKMKKATLELSLKQHKSKNAMHEKKIGEMEEWERREKERENSSKKVTKKREEKLRNCENIQNRAKRKREI